MQLPTNLIGNRYNKITGTIVFIILLTYRNNRYFFRVYIRIYISVTIVQGVTEEVSPAFFDSDKCHMINMTNDTCTILYWDV